MQTQQEEQSLWAKFSPSPASVLVVRLLPVFFAIVSPTSDAPTAIATNRRVEFAEAFFCFAKKNKLFNARVFEPLNA